MTSYKQSLTAESCLVEERFPDVEPSSDVSFSSPIIRKSEYLMGLAPNSLEYETAMLSYLKDKHKLCSTEFKHQRCTDCGKEFSGSALFTCGTSYCWECREMRTKKIFKRLMSKDLPYRKLFHFIIGSARVPLSEFGRSHIDGLRKNANRFLDAVSKRGYILQGEYVMDFTFDAASQTVFVHAHFAVIPFRGSHRCAPFFNQTITRLTNGQIRVVKLVGYKTKSNVLYYLAKRAAGILGHYEDGESSEHSIYGFRDFLSLRDWYKLLFRRRGVVQFGFPEGIGTNTAPVVQDVCPFCGSHNIETIGVIVKKRIECNSQTFLGKGGGT